MLSGVVIFAFIFPNLIAARNVVYRKCEPGDSTCDDVKIVGGDKVSISDYPYQVHLTLFKEGKTYHCGGSIIGENYVLTAAHCLRRVSKVVIRVGSNHSESGGQLYSSSDLIMHPKYSWVTKDYDVGIVRLEEPMKLDGVTSRPVQLIEADVILEPGTHLNIAGWGDSKESAGVGSPHLLAVTVPVSTNEQCLKAYGSIITPRMFCAGFEEGKKDSCQGDSGGAAVHNSVQVGIVSFGKGCARPEYPGIYTNLPAVREWIKEVTGI